MSLVTERADRLRRLMRDEDVSAVFDDLRQNAYHQFLQAVSDDDRREAHAFGKAVAMLEGAFTAHVDAGTREQMSEQSTER